MSGGVKEKLRIYEALLSVIKDEQCKIVLHLKRQNILLLCRVIESGLNGKENADELLSLLSKEAKEELETVVPECLKRAGLTEFYDKLKQL